MNALNPIDLDNWKQGKLDFECLLLSYEGRNHSSMAAELGLPFPNNIISVKWYHSDTWPVTDRKRIKHAQEQYDAGLTEMCQLKLQHHTLLLSFKRTIPTAPRRYFTLGQE